MNPALVPAPFPIGDQLMHRRCGLGRRYRAESHTLVAVRVALDDVDVLVLVPAGVPDLSPRQSVQLPNARVADRQPSGALVNQGQGIAVSAEFFLVAVAQ